MTKNDIKPERLESINPSTLEKVGSVPLTNPADVAAAVARARSAFPAWCALGLDARIRIMRRAQQLLLEQSEEVARLITLEMGKPFTESLTIELEPSVDLIYYYWKHAHKFLRNRTLPLHNLFFKRRKSYIHFQSLGVLANITPWNWPLLIPLGVICPALLAGNAIVFKPSEFTPLVGEKIREIFIEAGVPEDVFINIHGGAEVGRAIVDADVEKVFFTGSTEVGKIILKQASPDLKKTVLEMGGHDAAIVCADADLENTSSGILWGGFSNAGQNCNGIERVYVHRSVYQTFVNDLVDKVKKLHINDGMNTDTDLGPLATKAQFDKTVRIVSEAKASGLEILCGGKAYEDKRGYYFEPTVILNRSAGGRIPDEEIFGPVLFVELFDSEDEAIRLANESRFGLAASVWTSDTKRGEAIAARIEAGTVMVNDAIVSFGISEAGWTGIKESGVGWMHGEKGLDEMVNIQYINVDPMVHSQNMWWFPYSETMLEGIRAGMLFLFSNSLIKRVRAIPTALKRFGGYLLVNRKKTEKL